MDAELSGKVALVTGSSRGIGRGIALELAAAGCDLMLTGRDPGALDAVAAEIRGRGRQASVHAADLTASAEPAALVAALDNAFGRLDILVCNAGAVRRSNFFETGDAEWQEAFDQTLYPAIRMSRLVVPHMRARGSGAIIMIASIWGRESGGRMVYNAVKAAEISLAKAMAQQLAKDGIRVNSVAPGSTSVSLCA